MPLQEYAQSLTKRNPRHLFFYRPYVAPIAPQDIRVGAETVTVTGTIKVFNIGAVSIQLRVPFSGRTLDDLVNWHAYGTKPGCIAKTAEALEKPCDSTGMVTVFQGTS